MAKARAEVAGATVVGANHRRAGLPNQDAIGWLPASGRGDRLAVAVSDGHGSPSSPRSHRGSRFAVDVATQALWHLPAEVDEDALARAVVDIVRRWGEAVRGELEGHPLSPAELTRVEQRGGPAVRQALERRPMLAYGATLLFAVIERDRLILGQLGDGDVVLVSTDGRVRRPVPADPRLVAHATTSLCDEDAASSTRTRIVPAAGTRLLILATDGYANSFADDAAFLQVGRDLLGTVRQGGMDLVRESLPEWLSETTAQGSGDDISVVVAALGTARPFATVPAGPGAAPPERSAGAARPPRPPGTGPVSSRPPLRRRRPAHLVMSVGLAVMALAVLAAGASLLRSRTGAEPAPGTATVAAARPDWRLADARTLERISAGTSVLFSLPGRISDWYQVGNGALFLLDDGSIGHLPQDGDTVAITARAESPVRLLAAGDGYFLVTGDGMARWRVDPGTGDVTAVRPPWQLTSPSPRPLHPPQPSAPASARPEKIPPDGIRPTNPPPGTGRTAPGPVTTTPSIPGHYI